MNIFQAARVLWKQHRLRGHDFLVREKLIRHQKNELKKLREYAYKHSPFYAKFHKGLMDAPLEQLPVLTKSELMENWDEIVTDRALKLSEVKDFIGSLKGYKKFKNKYICNATSGTSGTPGIFVFNPAEWTTILASYQRPVERLANIFRLAIISTSAPWHQSALVIFTLENWSSPALLSDSTEPLPNIVKKLNNFQPECIALYSSMARQLAEEQLNGRLKIRPKAIYCVSDVLTHELRKIIKSAWGVQAINLYGATEAGCVAFECPNHTGFHLSEDLIIPEVLNEHNRQVKSGEFGTKFLVTVLGSRILPLIRYDLNDSVRASDDPCECGRTFNLIDGIQGTAEEIIFMEGRNGLQVAVQPSLFHKVMDKFRTGGWQIVQEKDNILEILLTSPAGDFNKDKMSENLSDRLKEAGIERFQIKIRYGTSLRRTALGKISLIEALRKP
jgi:phenylacetate-CoA ligase